MEEHSCHGLNNACFRTLSLSLGNLQDVVWRSGFPSNTTLSVLFTTMRSTIFMVNICVYNHPLNDL